MIIVYGKTRTLIDLLAPVDSFELESTVTHQKSDIDILEVAVGNLFYTYNMDFRYMDYGEYQYRGYKEGQLQETGLLQIQKEPEFIVPEEEETNIVMYDGRENSENESE